MNLSLLRPGTSDENIVKSVVEFNEYRLSDSFAPYDLICDIGACIGAFAQACLDRGAGRVMCFEPDPENYSLLRQHLAEPIREGRVETFPVAVTASVGFRTFSGPMKADAEVNHGGAYLFGKDGNSYGLDATFAGKPFRVVTIPFDAIEFPDGFTRRLLKLDCENSEHEIVQSEQVATFPQIVGEYHPYHSNTGETLKARLESLGFTVGLHPWPDSTLGLFFARI